ncbi:MAG TPA: hypothetical protein VLK32_06460 [Bacillota bacterium]|nr:hypothetical protein [Bacillota bacterium]
MTETHDLLEVIEDCSRQLRSRPRSGMLKEDCEVLSMASEVKPQEAPSLSPWDVLIWKLDALDKRLDAMDQGLNRRIDQLGERMDRLEARMDREFASLRGEIGGLRGEMQQDLRGARHSFAVLQLTTTLGLIAVLVSFWLAR